MKCPWQTREERRPKEIDVYGRLISPETRTTVFTDCIEDECPFYDGFKCKRVKDENRTD